MATGISLFYSKRLTVVISFFWLVIIMNNLPTGSTHDDKALMAEANILLHSREDLRKRLEPCNQGCNGQTGPCLAACAREGKAECKNECQTWVEGCFVMCSETMLSREELVVLRRQVSRRMRRKKL